MAAGAWSLTNGGRTELTKGTWLDADTYKIALFLSTSNLAASSTTYAALTNEHANGNGYTTGGNSVTVSRSGTTTVTITSTNPAVWTASGGSIIARYGVLYEVSGLVVAYFLLDSTPGDVTVTNGNTLTITISGSGILTLA